MKIDVNILKEMCQKQYILVIYLFFFFGESEKEYFGFKKLHINTKNENKKLFVKKL